MRSLASGLVATVAVLVASPGWSGGALPFYGAPLEPPAGRILHGWGQMSSFWFQGDPAGAGDPDDLAEYRKLVAPNQPALISFYVAPVEAQVGPFLMRLKGFMKGQPYFIPQIALYFLDAPLHEAVATGTADPLMRRLFEGLRDLKRPVLLRPGYEFNGVDAGYDPKLYATAFRRAATLAREVLGRRVATVWHAEPGGFAQGDCRRWDPGDAYADWWGLSLFYREHMTDPRTLAFLAEAATRRKPVLIAESSAWFHGPRTAPVRGAASEAEALAWHAALFDLIRTHPQIKGVNLIAVDWRRMSTKWPHIPGGLPDVRLTRWAGLAARHRKIISASAFIHSANAARWE